MFSLVFMLLDLATWAWLFRVSELCLKGFDGRFGLGLDGRFGLGLDRNMMGRVFKNLLGFCELNIC